MAAVDYFLKLAGIAGDSTDVKHKGEIEVESFSWGVSQTASLGGGGAGAGKAAFQDFHFTSLVSKASPNLMLKCADGAHLKNAVLVARGQDERGVANEFLKITLSDVLVSSFIDNASVGEGAEPHLRDAVSLRYASAAESTQQTRVGVTPAASGLLAFDAATNSFQVIEVPNGVFTVGTRGGAVARAIAEFDVRSLIGLLTSPFSASTLKLVTTEVREAAIQPSAEVVNTSSVNSEDVNKPKKIRFDVILYTPADLVLTTDDLTRKGKRIGTLTVDLNGDPATLSTDLTSLLQKRGLETFGIRLQLRDARIKTLDEDDTDENEDDVNVQDAANDPGSDDDPKNEGDDGDKTARPDVTASFTIELVLDTK